MTDTERDPDAPRRIGLRAFNKTKSFFNENDMIFEKIDLESDIGLDAILTFSRRGADAGRFVNVQVKGGRAYKRATHIEEFYKKHQGMVSLRSTDWRLWPEIRPPRGYEGHHIVDVDVRLKTIWSNARPAYVIVQDPDDDELYFGNLARMVDMQPLDQDLADAHTGMPNDGSVFHRYLATLHERISGLSDEERSRHKTWMPVYPDLRLTPDGLDQFLEYALTDARQPLPVRQSPAGEIETIVTYPDGTIGPSSEALEARKRLGLELHSRRRLQRRSRPDRYRRGCDPLVQAPAPVELKQRVRAAYPHAQHGSQLHDTFDDQPTRRPTAVWRHTVRPYGGSNYGHFSVRRPCDALYLDVT